MMTSTSATRSSKNMTSAFATFPEDAVPTEEWTVEQLLLHQFSKMIQSLDDDRTMELKRLDEQLSSGETEIYELCKENHAAVSTQQQQPPPQRGTSRTAASVVVRVVVLGGPHATQIFLLHPKRNQPCMLGRSNGKKFRENGVSLSKDAEVSTTHGRFLYDGASLYFVDIGSTNGSHWIKDDGSVVELDADEPFELFHGAVLSCGGTTMRIELDTA